MDKKKYLNIVRHYESCLEKHGDTHLGVDWLRFEEVDVRHRIMLDVIKKNDLEKVQLLDFGCGSADLCRYIREKKLDYISYSGLDLSQKFIDASKHKFPDNKFYCMDILDGCEGLPAFDYIVMNGVFTEKRDLSFDEMFSLFKDMVMRIFPKAKKGIAFNVMPKQVDWERKESFHLSLDLLAEFLVENISRNFVMRRDYGLYEYTTYVYR